MSDNARRFSDAAEASRAGFFAPYPMAYEGDRQVQRVHEVMLAAGYEDVLGAHDLTAFVAVAHSRYGLVCPAWFAGLLGRFFNVESSVYNAQLRAALTLYRAQPSAVRAVYELGGLDALLALVEAELPAEWGHR